MLAAAALIVCALVPQDAAQWRAHARAHWANGSFDHAAVAWARSLELEDDALARRELARIDGRWAAPIRTFWPADDCSEGWAGAPLLAVAAGRIAFGSDAIDVIDEATGELVVPTIEGGARPKQLSLSPDGRWAAIEFGTGADARLQLHDLDAGGAPTVVPIDLEEGAWLEDHVWSDDGSRLGVRYVEADRVTILVIDPNRALAAPVAIGSGDWRPFAFTADASIAVVARDAPGDGDVCDVTGVDLTTGEEIALLRVNWLNALRNDPISGQLMVNTDGMWAFVDPDQPGVVAMHLETPGTSSRLVDSVLDRETNRWTFAEWRQAVVREADRGVPVSPPLAPVSEPMDPQRGFTEGSISPNGRYVARETWNGIVVVWDTRSGKRLAPGLRTGAGVMALAFTSETRLVTADDAGAVRQWSVLDLEAVESPLGGGAHLIAPPSGDRALLSRRVGSLDVLDAAGNVLRSADCIPDADGVTVSRPRKTLAVHSHDQGVWTLDLDGGTEELELFLSDRTVQSVVFDPEGERVAIGATRRATVWDLDSGEIRGWHTPHWRTDGLGFGADGKLWLWSEFARTVSGDVNAQAVATGWVSKLGAGAAMLESLDEWRRVVWHDGSGRTQDVSALVARLGDVDEEGDVGFAAERAEVSPTRLLIGGHLVDPLSGEVLLELEAPDELSCVLTEDRLLVVRTGHRIELYDAADGTLLATHETELPVDAAWPIAATDHVAVCTTRVELVAVDASKNAEVGPAIDLGVGAQQAICLAGGRALLVRADGSLHSIELSTGTTSPFPGSPARGSGIVATSLDGSTVVLRAPDGEITVRDVATGTIRHRFDADDPGGPASSVALSPDGDRVGIVRGRSVHIQSTSNGETLARFDAAFAVDSVRFQAGTRRVVLIEAREPWPYEHAGGGYGIWDPTDPVDEVALNRFSHSSTWYGVSRDGRLYCAQDQFKINNWVDLTTGEIVGRARGTLPTGFGPAGLIEFPSGWIMRQTDGVFDVIRPGDGLDESWVAWFVDDEHAVIARRAAPTGIDLRVEPLGPARCAPLDGDPARLYADLCERWGLRADDSGQVVRTTSVR